MSPYSNERSKRPVDLTYTNLSSDAPEFNPVVQYPTWSTADSSSSNRMFHLQTQTAHAQETIADPFHQPDLSTDLQQLDGEPVENTADSFNIPWDIQSGSGSPENKMAGLSSESNLNKWSHPNIEVLCPRVGGCSAVSPLYRRTSSYSPEFSGTNVDGAIGGMVSPKSPRDSYPDALKVAEQLLQVRHENLDDTVNEMGSYSNPRFKTEFCRNFREKGNCLYGDQCQFAHGKTELRQDVVRHSKYKTKFCQKFWIGGWCVYGPRCNFIHLEEEAANAYKTEIPAAPMGLRPFQSTTLRKNSESSIDSGIETAFTFPPPDHRTNSRKIVKNSSPLPTKMQVGERNVISNMDRNRSGTNGDPVSADHELLVKLLEQSGVGLDYLLERLCLKSEPEKAQGWKERNGLRLQLPGFGSLLDNCLIAHPETNPIPVSAPAANIRSTQIFFT